MYLVTLGKNVQLASGGGSYRARFGRCLQNLWAEISGSKAALLNPLLLQNSKTRLRKMLSKTSKIHVIKMKFKRTHQLLINMRLTFENSINSNRAKLMFMLSAYKKEIDNYRTEIAKSKDKTIKHLIKPLTNLEKTAPI